MAMISIAHPEFRDELFFEAKKMGLLSTERTLSESIHGVYPIHLEETIEMAGEQVTVRPAKPVDESIVREDVLEIGVLGGVYPARLGMGVRKFGRTTGLTTGTIRVMDASVTVMYGAQEARFEDQVVTTPISEPGDSGSVPARFYRRSRQASGRLGFAGRPG